MTGAELPSPAEPPRKKRGKRGARKHPGVVLIKPNERTQAGWRARWVDPDRGKTTSKTLPAHAARTLEARQAWAVLKSREIMKRREALESGAVRARGVSLEEAVEIYFSEAATRLRKKTIVGYRKAAARFLAWARLAGVRSCDDLSKGRLLKFRSAVATSLRTSPVKGGRRGQRRAEEGKRISDFTVNGVLAPMRTILGYLADREFFPYLNDADLRRGLKKESATVEGIEFLDQSEILALVKAAGAHDTITFAETREEHAGSKPRGGTRRYTSVQPLVFVLLLSGMRLNEALTLTWGAIRWAGPGSIRLPGSRSKTKRYRRIDLSVSPMLRKILEILHEPNADPKGRVLEITPHEAKAAALRLRKLGAPEAFTWQALRRTCSTFLNCAPGIFGAASAHRSAKQLGHSVAVAEEHYADLVVVDPSARTLEAAMGIDDLLA
jgi:integrase